jgi:hypothetical protein
MASQEKPSVFRVRDIFPPYNKDNNQPKGVIDWEQMAPQDPQPKPLEAADDIPKFDLGMEVLARQRQAASQKRQSPSQKKFELHTPNPPVKELNQNTPTALMDTPAAPPKPQVPQFLKEETIQPPQPKPQPQITEEPKFDAELITKPVSHIADRLMPIMSQTEEQLIFNIVESDIKKYL